MSDGSMSLRCGARPPARLFQYRCRASMLPLEPSQFTIPKTWRESQTLSSGIRARELGVRKRIERLVDRYRIRRRELAVDLEALQQAEAHVAAGGEAFGIIDPRQGEHDAGAAQALELRLAPHQLRGEARLPEHLRHVRLELADVDDADHLRRKPVERDRAPARLDEIAGSDELGEVRHHVAGAELE